MQQPKTTYVTIHIFALLHALTTLLFKMWFGRDDYALTILTIAMVIYIARQWQRPMSIGMSLAILACFTGYYVGDLGVGAFFPKFGIAGNMFTTLTVTEFIGWITYLIVRQNKINENDWSWQTIRLKRLYLPHVFFITTLVFVYRYFLIDLLSSMKGSINFIDFIALTLSNVLLTISILWANIATARIFSKIIWFEQHSLCRLSLEYLYLISVSLISTMIVYGSSNAIDIEIFYRKTFLIHFLSVLTFASTVYYLTNIIIYYRHKQNAELNRQIIKRKKANYQYGRLKQQLNPHFLFNSLNVLDHLVLTDPKRASTFIHKLAGVYRYQLNQENKNTVSLDEELEFLSAYYNLLQERFGSGFVLTISIDDSIRKTHQIVPCALQLLAENAVKHNTISEDKPLLLTLHAIGDSLVVSNNLQPKITLHSWGIGLQSINEQYASLGYKNIDITNNNKEFIVTVPLIKK